MEVEANRVIATRRRAREDALLVAGAEVLLLIRTLVVGPHMVVARAKAHRRRLRVNAAQKLIGQRERDRELAEAPELAVLEIAKRRLRIGRRGGNRRGLVDQ